MGRVGELKVRWEGEILAYWSKVGYVFLRGLE